MSSIVLGLSPLVIAFLAIMSGTTGITIDVVMPASVGIAEGLGVSPSKIQTTLSVILAGAAIGQLLYGPLSDWLGRRVVIFVSFLLYGVVSALCAMTINIDNFIVYRFLQGMIGTAGSVLARAIIRDLFRGAAFTKAMSMVIMAMGLVLVSAPFIGSTILKFFGWREIFWGLSAYAFIWSILIFITIPETLSKGNRITFTPSKILFSFLSVFMNKQARGYIICMSFGTSGATAYLAITPFLCIQTFGLTPSQFALFLSTMTMGMLVAIFINSFLVTRFSLDKINYLLCILSLISALVLLINAFMAWGGLWGITIPLFFYFAPGGALIVNSISVIMNNMGHIAGTASGVIGFTQATIGSLMGFIVASINDSTAITLSILIAASAILKLGSFKFMVQGKSP